MKRTLVLGATDNPTRYAYMAVMSLTRHGHEVVPVGIKKGEVAGIPIKNQIPEDTEVDTVTLYLNPTNQKPWYDSIIKLKPKRIIFNPGTENPELRKMALDNNIEPVIACTLVMLSAGSY